MSGKLPFGLERALKMEWYGQASLDLALRTRELVEANRLTETSRQQIMTAFRDAGDDFDLVEIGTRTAISNAGLALPEALYLESAVEQIRSEQQPRTWSECVGIAGQLEQQTSPSRLPQVTAITPPPPTMNSPHRTL